MDDEVHQLYRHLGLSGWHLPGRGSTIILSELHAQRLTGYRQEGFRLQECLK